MGKSTSIKPTHKAIKTYYQRLQTYRDERVEHEGEVETAFQQLLADTARSHGWTLLPKLKLQVKAGARRGSPDPAATKNIYPDGTLRDFFNLRRGFWEAKDTHDDLDVEISKDRQGLPAFEHHLRRHAHGRPLPKRRGALPPRPDRSQAIGLAPQRILRLHRAGDRGLPAGG